MLKLPPKTRDHARSLRRDATDAEQLLWHLLRDRSLGGFKFRRQKPFPPFVVDFYCAEKRLALELDGGQHAEAENEEYDRRRSEHLARLGVRVLRFWNNQVLGETEAVLEAIWGALMEEGTPSPGRALRASASPASGRGKAR